MPHIRVPGKGVPVQAMVGRRHKGRRAAHQRPSLSGCAAFVLVATFSLYFEAVPLHPYLPVILCGDLSVRRGISHHDRCYRGNCYPGIGFLFGMTSRRGISHRRGTRCPRGGR
jgi:hypothetical protein